MAFGGVPLKTLVIGNGLVNQSSVGQDVFLNVCETLESVNIDAPKALGTYGQYPSSFFRRDGQQVYYYGYSGLHFGRFYDDTNNYNTTAYQCPKLEAITLGDNVITVGNNAFDAYQDFTSLTSLALGSSITSIGSNAFRGMTNLVSLTIPDSVENIGQSAFLNATSLTSLIEKIVIIKCLVQSQMLLEVQ
jgi:hypothetical protein